MAELAVAAVIHKTVDILGNILVNEAARMYWVKEDFGWIETELRRMQSFLRDLDATQSANHGVTNLVRDVRILAYDVEDIIDSYIPKVASQNKNFVDWVTKRLHCFPCRNHHKFDMEIAGIKKRVEDINSCRTTYGINENTAGRGVEEWNPRQSYPHVEVPVVIGFQKHIKALEARLLDAEIVFSVTSIIGMPGVGKTTLAKKIYNSVKVHFQCSAWVYISQEPKLRDLLQDIARQVGLEKEQREENLEANLFNFLKEKRYVIVIDDIWDVKAWDFLKNGIPIDCENRNRLVLTSRNKDVGLSIGGRSCLHELQPLNPEMSWKLFSQFVKIPIESTDHGELMHLGTQILKRCGGVPLAIVTIAGLLSTKGVTEHEWKGVLNKMAQEKNEVLALSYRDLPTVLKPCFLYFGMFPEDHIIPVRNLINLWVAEGFIQSQGRQTLEEAGEDYLNELITRNIIQVEKRRYDGRIKSCRIHDVLRDLCISIAQEEDFFKIQSGDDSLMRALQSRRAAIHNKSIDNGTSLNHQFPKLRTLLHFNEQYDIRRTILLQKWQPCPYTLQIGNLVHILLRFRLLRVLRLEGLKNGTRLPDQIGNLVHIRYLHLSGIGLVLPITIGNLNNLHVLDCPNCPDLILPTVIWKMEKLRHVFIDITTRFEHPSKFSQMISQFQAAEEVSLPNLQTLCVLNAEFLKADCLRQLTRLINLGIHCTMEQYFTDILKYTTHLSETLEKLKLSCFNNSSEDLPALNFSGYHNLRELYLEGVITKLPKFSKNLTKLTLKNNELENDPLMELGMLPKLRVLKLKIASYMGDVMAITVPDSFPSLELLEIGLDLNELQIEGYGDRVMPKLRRVVAGDIPILNIWSYRLKRFFANLSLSYQECLNLDELGKKFSGYMKEEMTEQKIAESPEVFLGNTYELGESSSHVPTMCPPSPFIQSAPRSNAHLSFQHNW